MLTLNARTFFRTNRHDIQERYGSFILIAKWSIRICYILGRPKHYHFRWMVVRNLSLALEAMHLVRNLSLALEAMHRVRALCLAAAGGHGAGRLMLAHWQVAEAGEEVSNDNGYSRFRSHLFDLEFNVYELNISFPNSPLCAAPGAVHPKPAGPLQTLNGMSLYAVPRAVHPKQSFPHQILNGMSLYAVPGAVHPKPAGRLVGVYCCGLVGF